MNNRIEKLREELENYLKENNVPKRDWLGVMNAIDDQVQRAALQTPIPILVELNPISKQLRGRDIVEKERKIAVKLLEQISCNISEWNNTNLVIEKYFNEELRVVGDTEWLCRKIEEFFIENKIPKTIWLEVVDITHELIRDTLMGISINRLVELNYVDEND